MAVGAVFAVLAGSGTASAAGSPGDVDPMAAPPQVHGPEKAGLAAAGSRPVSGKSPSAGPQFKKSGSAWRVIAPEAVLRNTRGTFKFEQRMKTYRNKSESGTPAPSPDSDPERLAARQVTETWQRITAWLEHNAPAGRYPPRGSGRSR